MNAITLKHPWPFAIRYMGKRVENRVWRPPSTQIGERIAIHGARVPRASQSVQRSLRIINDLISQHGTPEQLANREITLDDICIGGIFCTAIIDHVTAFGTDHVSETDPWFDCVPGNYGWFLRDLIFAPQPIQIDGRLGLWRIPDEVVKIMICGGLIPPL